MQDFKGNEVWVGGCWGCAVGAVVGIALAIGLLSTCALNHFVISDVETLFLILEILVIVIGALAGVFIGIKIARERVHTASSIPPHVDEAARSHFNPPTPRTTTEDRIKPPDEPDPTEPHP